MAKELPILLAEDDENDVLLLRRALRICGFPNPLQVVSDGEMAIAYLRGDGAYADRSQHPLPTLILTDLKMPRRSGFDLIGWIRGRAELQNTPIIVLSASGESSDIDRAYQLGANFYFVKPGKFDECVNLVKALAHWLKLEESAPLRRPNSFGQNRTQLPAS
jgi:CheY-like chemotaxis protein